MTATQVAVPVKVGWGSGDDSWPPFDDNDDGPDEWDGPREHALEVLWAFADLEESRPR